MVPKFLLCDNTDLPEEIFVLHTEFPRFLYNLDTEDIEWFDDVEFEKEGDTPQELIDLIEQAEAFYQREVDIYEQMEE
jgi:hypothetical protein